MSILWGGSFFFVDVAVKEIPPLTIVLGRVALASIILLAIVYLKGERLEWNAFVGIGLIFIGLIAIDGRLLKSLSGNINKIFGIMKSDRFSDILSMLFLRCATMTWLTMEQMKRRWPTDGTASELPKEKGGGSVLKFPSGTCKSDQSGAEQENGGSFRNGCSSKSKI